jgi:general L-amino acid transport system permease protein
VSRRTTQGPPRPPLRLRAVLGQVLLLVVVGLVLAWFAANVADNLARRNMGVSFTFLAQPAGFDIPFRILPWQATDTYGRALVVSFANSLLIATLAIIAASLLGLLLGLMRLSGNPLARWVSRGVMEVIRNTPQLTQIVFWYVAVLSALPQARASLHPFEGWFLNVRGLFLPAPEPGAATMVLLWAGLALLLAAPWLRHRLAARGVPPFLSYIPALALLGFTFLSVASWERPELRGFNFRGGWRVPPELLALWLGLFVYGAGFIAEIVRESILGVHRGQAEAAQSLGLTPWRTMSLVILPQAMSAAVPPLTSQYLNIIKSSSLGAAVAYPEVVQIFARVVLNQSGRAIEVMSIVLGVFLAVNLLVSFALNAWNARRHA